MKNLKKSFLSALFLISSVSLSGDIPNGVGSDIGIKIMGAIIQRDKDRSVVLIKEDESGKVIALRVGQAVMKKYRIDEIANEFIVISEKGAQKRIYQDKFANSAVASKGYTAPAANSTFKYSENYSEDGFERKKGSIRMTGMYRDNLIKNDLSKILMQATAEPHMENGQIVGFKLSQIDPESIFDKSGVRENDIVTSINGTQLNNVSAAIKLLHSLKKENSINLTVLRDGQESEITISVD